MNTLFSLTPALTGCVLLARFPVQAELRRRPELAGLPFAITAADRRPDRVLAAAPAATGVYSGQPVSEALAGCPGLLLLPEDRLYLEQCQAELLAALQRTADRVEPAQPGRFYLNLAGMTALYGGLAGLAEAILAAAAAEWRPRLGLAAGGKFPAFLAARQAAPGGWLLAPGGKELASWLAALPISLLPLPAADSARLGELGLNTLGAVGRLPAEQLTDFLGAAGRRISQLARGRDPEPVQPVLTPVEHSERLVFPWPLAGIEGLLMAVRSLCEALGQRSVFQDWMAGRALLSGDLLEGGSWRWERLLRRPAGSAAALYAALQAGLSAVDRAGRSALPMGDLTDLTLTVGALSPQRGFQAGLAQAVGEGRGRSVAIPGVARPTPLDVASPLPERRWMLGSGRKVLAEPAAVRVERREGIPWRVGSPRPAQPEQLVAAVADCWELDTDWWQPEPVSRRYWSLALADGGLVTVFEDRRSGAWFRQG